MEIDRTKVGGRLYKSSRSSCKFVILVGVGGIIWGYMEAHGSFHGIYSWELQLMEALEASILTDGRNFHVFSWKLPLTSMQVI